MNCMMLKAICLTFVMSVVTSNLYAEAQKPSRIKYYATHIITDTIAGATWIGLTAGAAATGIIAAINNKPPLLEGLATIVAPACAGGTVGAYVRYKTPQWTDTYLLGIERRRTGKQNLIVFLNRLFYPIGILTGEYLAYTDDQVAENPYNADAKKVLPSVAHQATISVMQHDDHK